MASTEKKLCTLCNDDDGTSAEAVTWCTECEVFLCTDCEKHHTKSRASKDHKTISTKDYHKLPKFMLEISSQCRDHKKKFELYCSCHSCPCCVQCVTDKHQKCQDMKPLSDVLKQVKSSASVHLLEKDLNDVRQTFEEITNDLNRRLKTNNIQKLKAADQIRSMRKLIDNYFNKLEKDILDDLESKQLKLKSKINPIPQQLTQRANEISQLQSEFSKMTKYATELQMYAGLREIEKITSQAAQDIEDLKIEGQLDENNLEVTISSEIQLILKDVKSFGDIKIQTSPFAVQVKTGRKDQAQFLFQNYHGIEQIKPSMLRKMIIPTKFKSTVDIYACTILPDGKYIILDSHSTISNLLLFSNDGMFIREVVSFTGQSYDVCFIRPKTVAVTLEIENKTELVNVEKNKIIKTMHLSHDCNAIASDGQMLVISSTEKSTIVNLNDNSHTILEGVWADGIALFKGNIYGTIFNENKVFCYKITGEPLWTFQHHDIVKPGGIILDIRMDLFI